MPHVTNSVQPVNCEASLTNASHPFWVDVAVSNESPRQAQKHVNFVVLFVLKVFKLKLSQIQLHLFTFYNTEGCWNFSHCILVCFDNWFVQTITCPARKEPKSMVLHKLLSIGSVHDTINDFKDKTISRNSDNAIILAKRNFILNDIIRMLTSFSMLESHFNVCLFK